MMEFPKGERVGSLGVRLGLLGLLCLLISTLALTLSYRAQLHSLRDTIIERCEVRLRYDTASQDARKASVRFYERLLAQIEHTPQRPGTEAARAEYVAALHEVIDAMDETIKAGVPGSCSEYQSAVIPPASFR